MCVFLECYAVGHGKKARDSRNSTSICVFFEKYAFCNPENARDSRNTHKSKIKEHFPQGA